MNPAYGTFSDPNQIIERGWRNRDKESIPNPPLTIVVAIKPINALAGVPDSITLRVNVSVTKPWQRIAQDIWEVQISPDEFKQKLEQMKSSGQVWRALKRQLQAMDPNLPLSQPFDFDMDYKTPPYLVMRDVFAGADFGPTAPIRNPANFTAADVPNLPVAYLLDRAQGDYVLNDPKNNPQDANHDDGVRRTQFSLLGVARRSARAAAWAGRFGSGSPDGQMTGIAQAEVFNPTSWDLWTQDWHAQLVPVTNLGEWMARLRERASGDAAASARVSEVDLDAAVDYLQQVLTLDDPNDSLIRH